MAVRTNPVLVQGILLSDYGAKTDGTLPSLEPFVATASAIVDRVRTCAIAKGLTLSATELELIERWLAAHAYVQSDQTFASKSTQGASASFHGKTGLQLESSRYGQMAMTLDYSGCLSAIDKRRMAGVSWMGKTEPEQLDYRDRME